MSPAGSSQVENIQPFSAKDLSIRSLGDRIRDLGQLRNLYPNTPKDQAFGSHYNSEWWEQRGPGLGAAPAARLWGGAGGAARGAEGFGSRVLLAPGAAKAGAASSRARRWLAAASPLPAEEQTGKDGRGYVSTAIKMTVESERWVGAGGCRRALVEACAWADDSGQPEHRCWARGFLSGGKGEMGRCS